MTEFSSTSITYRPKVNLYLHSCAMITAQPTFTGLEGSCVPIIEGSPLIEPDHKAFIPPAMLRRMSKVLRLSVTCATQALRNANGQTANAVVVGTGLGCVRDTLRFMDDMHQGNEGVLSPTAFIQSTHNTMAGQIALNLGIKGYNLTHVQGMQSFEMAVTDAANYLIDYPDHTLLLGGMDEQTDELRSILHRLAHAEKFELPVLGEGAVVFVATSSPQGALCRITNVQTWHDCPSIEVLDVLNRSDFQPDLIIGPPEFAAFGKAHIDPLPYFGLSYSLSALSSGLGYLILNGWGQSEAFNLGETPHSVAIITTFAGHTGLIQLQKA